VKSGDLNYDELVQACRNVGFDLRCSLCAQLFYTGHGAGVGQSHDEGCFSSRSRTGGGTVLEARVSGTTDLRSQALELYRPPFRREYGYVFDSRSDTIVSVLRPRGSRVKSPLDPNPLQDAAGDLVAEALTRFWEAELEQFPPRGSG